jgi:beta-glucosidase
VLNEVDVDTVNELQRIAVEESRLGIPAADRPGRDPRLQDDLSDSPRARPHPGIRSSRKPLRVSAAEATRCGVNWTFAPMIDIARDPRWGRIAESPGEDPYLGASWATRWSKGFQGDGSRRTGAIAACAKHFAGYGAAESGRDYNTANVPENEMRNVYLRPFKAAADCGRRHLHDGLLRPDGVLPRATPGCWTTYCVRSGATTAWSSATGSPSWR